MLWFRSLDAIGIRLVSVACIFLFLVFPSVAQSQFRDSGAAADDSQLPSLSAQLLAEGLPALARASREKGNPVQGAIYFAQKSLRCSECHARGGNAIAGARDALQRLGPNLSLLSESIPDEAVVESLLNPSARIEQEYQSVLIITADGKQLSGRVIEEINSDKLLLQEQVEPYRLIELPADEIVQRKISDQSAMPSGLVDSLPDRQAFLDLVSYLYQIRGTGGVGIPEAMQAAAMGQRIAGLSLLDEFRCARCHDASGVVGVERATHANPVGPDLREVSGRVDPLYLRAFIANPHASKPGTVMPDNMQGMNAERREEVASSIAAFLESLSDREFSRTEIEEESVERGLKLFHSVGCVACHGPMTRDQQDMAVDSQSSEQAIGRDLTMEPIAHLFNLGKLAGKYSLSSLTELLEDPRQARPSARMPNLGLTHWEAQDIASYLLDRDGNYREASNLSDSSAVAVPSGQVRGQDLDGSSPDAQNAIAQKIKDGERWFVTLNCVQCHELEGLSQGRNFLSLKELDLNAKSGSCLSANEATQVFVPRYDLRDEQILAMKEAIRRLGEALSVDEEIHWSLRSLRCTACHDRDGVGGAHPSLDVYFQTTNQNLGPQGRLPPSLDSVGSKLNPKWLRQVLVEGRAVRPYMLTRMPVFGLGNVEGLLEHFYEADQPMPHDFVQLPDTKENRDAMTEMIGRNGLNCIACHTFQNRGADTMPALDLTEMAERLQPGWFYQYMLSPQSIRPNTVMPSFWPGGRVIRRDLMDGTTPTQITGVWNYLQRGRQAPTPRGLQFEPIELLSDGREAVMLRRSYPNIGKRGIGVGYPSGINLAYDAEQMRLALMWKGGFADPGGVWRGQGHGRVRPLSRELWSLGLGPDLDSERKAWLVDDGRPPNHQFRGYLLDAERRPTFLYQFGVIEVEDYFFDAVSSGGSRPEDESLKFSRTLKLKSDQFVAGLRFRVATGSAIKSLKPRHYLVDDRLKVIVPEGFEATVVTGETGEALRLLFDVPVGQTTVEIEYVW
ncbi:MAG: c-type cytochrome [Rubripirellula sp.]|nr:c-type cytochrome [Rubripirellula sp.]